MKDYKIINLGDYYVVEYHNRYIGDRKYKHYEEAVNDIYKYYQDIDTYESKDERLRKEKVEKRNSKIDQILG